MLRRHSRVLMAAAVTAALAAPTAQAGHGQSQFREGADRGRQRRRGRHRRRARHQGGDRHDAAGRQRGRRDGRRRGRARGHRAVLGRDRRRRVHGHPHAARQGHDDRRPREGAGRDATGHVHRRRRPGPAQQRALHRPVGRRARHRRAVGPGARPLRDEVAAQAAPAGDRRRPRGLRRRPDVLRPDAGRRRLLRRHPVHGGDLPRSRRHAARRRHHAAQPRPGARVRAHRPLRAARVLPRADRACHRRRRCSTRRRDRTPTTPGSPA